MELQTLKSEARTAYGTRVSRALRETGRVPVVIYGHGEAPETASLLLEEVEFSLMHGARMLEVDFGGKAQAFLIKEVQYNHLGDTPIHLDLARVSMDEKVKVRVGIELRGIAKGISDGGVVEQHLADLEVECMVSEIPDTLHPLITPLELGESLLVKDLELPSGVSATADPEERVATVRVFADEPEAADEDDETESDSEPERIGRVRKDEDGEGEAKKG